MYAIVLSCQALDRLTVFLSQDPAAWIVGLKLRLIEIYRAGVGCLMSAL